MRFEQQLRTFLRILQEYPCDTPLSKFLPQYFRANKQMGSNDRRTASRLLYNYFRMGKASADLPAEQRLFLAEFLCSTGENSFLQYFDPQLAGQNQLSLNEKISWLEKQGYGFKLKDVFPFHEHLSVGIDKQEFLKSFFIQPDLFIRIHPGKEKLVREKLEDAEIPFTVENGQALRLANGTKLEQLFPNQKPFEVQDLSSQQTGDYFKPQKQDYWWDACAASGGKSLLLIQHEPQIKLVVSDVRESILENLDERFHNAGIMKYQKKVLDLTKNPDLYLHDYQFDGIILDAPCSGSGTWGRSPEMISQFRENRIETFQRLQRSIASNAIKYLKPGKPLIYITCSSFKEENEQNIRFLTQELKLEPEEQKILKGYEHKVDTIFVARLLKH